MPRRRDLRKGAFLPMPNMTNFSHPRTEDIPLMNMEVERLQREHDELKMRLGELNSRVYLSPVEEIERKNLQKLKLMKKDRIATLSSNPIASS